MPTSFHNWPNEKGNDTLTHKRPVGSAQQNLGNLRVPIVRQEQISLKAAINTCKKKKCGQVSLHLLVLPPFARHPLTSVPESTQTSVRHNAYFLTHTYAYSYTANTQLRPPCFLRGAHHGEHLVGRR
eukprot:5254924-Amphidinium_carterae.2